MKFRRLFKKAAAALMAAVTALSVLPATTAFAAGDIGTISFTHTYDSSGNTMRYNSSAVFDGYTAGGTGKYKYRENGKHLEKGFLRYLERPFHKPEKGGWTCPALWVSRQPQSSVGQ